MRWYMMRLSRLAIIAAALMISAAAQAQISGDTIKIGILNDMSGLYADLGGQGSVEAARMAIADFGGTVNGKKIELVSADHQNKPDVGGAIARQWYDNDKVDAIVDVPTSSVALAVQDVARERKKVFLISTAASSDLTGKACSATGIHWTYDTVALANGTGSAVANAGGDTINSIKQAAEFGLVEGGQKMAGLLVFVTDIHSLGLKTANGLQLTEAFYWDQTDETRAWSKRFMEKINHAPTMVQAGVYGAVMHYMNAIKAIGSDDGLTVVKKMKETPINDFMTKNGKILENGRVIRDMYLFEVKKPAESKGPWDYYKQIATIPGEQAFKRPGGNECPLVKGRGRVANITPLP